MGLGIIAALFVATDGPYYGIDRVVPWGIEADARKYQGPYPVVAHPPCERWGRYWGGGPSAHVKKKLGDDGGCFQSALESVRKYGGVLEHPAHSRAWEAFGIGKPPRSGYWAIADKWGFTCQVEQGNYGHPARKSTWLYAAHVSMLPSLVWGPCREKKVRLDEGFHTAEERRIARASGAKPIKRLTRKELAYTPEPFRDLLIRIARNVRF